MKLDIYSSLEKKRFGPLIVILYLMIVGSVSFALRGAFNTEIRYSYLVLTTEILVLSLYFFIIFIIFGILAKKPNIDRTLENLIYFYWLLALTPLMSGLTGGTVYNTRLISAMNLSVRQLFQGEAGMVIIVVVIISILLCYRIFTRFPSKHKAPTYGILAFAATLALSFPSFFIRRVTVDGNTFVLYELLRTDMVSGGGLPSTQQLSNLLLNQGYHLYIVLLLIEISVMVSILLYLTSKDFFSSLIRNLKPFRSIHFIMLVLIGIIVVRKISPDYALDPLALNHFPFVLLAVFCSAFFIWQFTSLLNDLYDVSIDKLAHPDRPLVQEHKHEKIYLELCIVIAIVSSWFTILLGPFIFLLNSMAIFAAVIYSVPPIRLRNRPYGHICIGLGSVIALLVGVYSPTGWTDGIASNAPYHPRAIPFYSDVLQLSFLLFVVLSISPLINAISDYEGDLRSGVKNVYTVYGLEKGKKIVSVLIIFLFLSPLLMFHSLQDIVVLVPPAIVSSILFYKGEKWKALFGLYFLILIYCLLRFLEFI